MGTDNLTPFTFQADIMNGVDPSPQDIALENGFFTQHKVKVFGYNQQVVDSLTTSIRETALKAGVPVVGVYETMPTPGYDYQSWMLAEVNAIEQGGGRQDLHPEAVMSRRGTTPRRCQRREVLRVDGVSVALSRAADPRRGQLRRPGRASSPG